MSAAPARSGHTLMWAARTALRDARGSRARALLYAASMALGIAALVAMGSLEADVARAVDGQTRNMVGADLVVWSRTPFDPETRAFLADTPGETAHYQSFAGMVRFPKAEQSHLARVRALDGPYPFYGTLETEPVEAAHTFRTGKYLLAARSLVERTGAQIGDPVVLGDTTFTLAGILERTPGETLAAGNLGPRVYIPFQELEGTGLIRTGSRVFYTQAFQFPVGVDVEAFVAEHEAFFRSHRLRYDTVAKRKENLGEAMANLGDYLNLTACLALLLGGLGVAGAVHYHLKQKTRQIATMRCLGAGVGQVAAVYFIQVGAMSLAACVLGAALGVAFQFMLPLLVHGLLPIQFAPRLHLGAVGVAVVWGLVMSLLLTAMPLLRLRRISPISCFRPEHMPAGAARQAALVVPAVALLWWIFAWIRTGSWQKSGLFTLSLLLCLGILLLTARLLARTARAVVRDRWPFPLRHGLANLFRPHNQTAAFLVILGMGIILVTVPAGMRAMLTASFQGNLDSARPNFIAFDIQPDQIEGVTGLVRESNLQLGDVVPIVPMRLTHIKGQSVTEMAEDLPEWAVQREYRSTYRAAFTPTEKLVAGTWIDHASADDALIPVSLEEDIAETLKVGLDDQLTLNVLGVPMEVRVASLRKVDWQSMQPNFFMLFPVGVLEDAPQMFVLTTKTADTVEAGRLQQRLTAAYPNVSSMDLTEVVRTVDDIIAKAAAAVRFLAALCVATGFLMLAGAVWNSRTERLGEWALMRTIGAGRGQMAAATLIEYALLGVFASVTGLLPALGALWALARFVFEVPAFPEPSALLPAPVLLPLLTLLLGRLALGGIWGSTPLYVLRGEDE